MRTLCILFALASFTIQALAIPPKSVTEGDSKDAGSPFKPLKASSPAEMAAGFFREALTPFGEWVEIGEFGRCWKPKVDSKWAPYTVGRWGYSEFGWTWISAEEFGGLVYHYGRWMKLRGEGWCWVPDLEWGPAWVSWRYGTQAVGWAPLPPKAKWNRETGISVWADKEYGIGPDLYAFCPNPSFGEEVLAKVLLPNRDNSDKMTRTVNVTNLSATKKSIFGGGPAFDWVAARSTNPIPIIRVVKERSLVKFRQELSEATVSPASFKGLLQDKTLTLIAPEWGILADPRRASALGFTIDEGEEPVKRAYVEGEEAPGAPIVSEEAKRKRPRSIATPVQLSGWESVTDESVRSSLQAKIARETAGLSPQNAPAEPFRPERDTPGKAAF